MGDDYFARIKQLALRQKLKCFFLDSRLEERNQLRRTQLQRLLPFLASSSSSSVPPSPLKGGNSLANSHAHPSNHSLSSEEANSLHYANSNPGSNNSLHAEGEQMQTKLKQLKGIIIPSLALSFSQGGEEEDLIKELTPEQRKISKRITTRESFEGGTDFFDGGAGREDSKEASGAGTGTGAGSGVDNFSDSPLGGAAAGAGAAAGGNSSIPPQTRPTTKKALLKKASSGASNHRIDYDTFESMMVDCGLPELASRSVFKIFDLNHCGRLCALCAML